MKMLGKIIGRNFEYKRGQIIYLDLGIEGIKGSEQKGERPCVVIQNNTGNHFSPNIIVVPVTSQLTKRPIPTHVELDKDKYNLDRNSIILAEQVKTVSKERCKNFLGELEPNDMDKLNRAISISLGLM